MNTETTPMKITSHKPNEGAFGRLAVAQKEEGTLSPLFDHLAFEEVLQLAKRENASDIHFSGNGRIALRINGALTFLAYAVIAPQIAEQIIESLMPDDAMRAKLRAEKEYDFCYAHHDGTNYRCNAYYKNGAASISMRRISESIPTLDEIQAPLKIKELLQKKQGLVLVCGPTGHGKTTTMAAMINELNETRDEHILTLEDPIEHVFESKRCMISQRELHTDTHSFENSLRAAMRQDPDIIVVGEVRDRETAEAVFHLVSTGHLVISTVHATSAPQTLYRIARMFRADERDMVLAQLADAVLGIINQRLVPTVEGNRTAIFELLIANYAARNAIRSGDVAQLVNTITSSSDEGMISFEQSVRQLLALGKIDHQVVAPYLEQEPFLKIFA
jgi:twitching motility protein PilT